MRSSTVRPRIDRPLFYDSTNTLLLAAVAKIDTTPLPPAADLMAPADFLARAVDLNGDPSLSGLNVNSATGR